LDEVIYSGVLGQLTHLLYNKDEQIVRASLSTLLKIANSSYYHALQVQTVDTRITELLMFLMLHANSSVTIILAAELLDSITVSVKPDLFPTDAVNIMEKMICKYSDFYIIKPVLNILRKIGMHNDSSPTFLSIGLRLIKFLEHWSADVIINTLCIIRYWKMYWLVGLYNSMYKLFSHVNPDVVVEAIKLLTVGRDSMGIYGVTELNKMILTRCYDDKPIQDRAVYYMSCYRSTFTSLYFECIETMLDTLENSSLDVMRNALWVLDKMLEKKEESALKVLTILEGEKILLRAWAGVCRSLAGELLEEYFEFEDPFLKRLKHSIDDLVLSDITFTCIK
jgi:hypothetical protein